MTRFTIGLLLLFVAGCTQTPLPGIPLTLATADLRGDCPAAGLQPVRLDRDADAMEFISVADGQRVEVVWPGGFAARLVDGVGRLYASDGEEIATEGDILRDLGGASDVAGSGFFVCSIGNTVYGSEPAEPA